MRGWWAEVNQSSCSADLKEESEAEGDKVFKLKGRRQKAAVSDTPIARKCKHRQSSNHLGGLRKGL